MNRKLVAACAVVLSALPLAASAQEAPAGPSQDAGWHNAQQAALASRQASDGWGWLEGGVLWRRVAGSAGRRACSIST